MSLNKMPTMYAEKRFELGSAKDRLMDAFQSLPYPNPEFVDRISYDFGRTKTVLLQFGQTRFSGKHFRHYTLTILMTEHDGYQGADIMTNPREEALARAAVEALQILGFKAPA